MAKLSKRSGTRKELEALYQRAIDANELHLAFDILKLVLLGES